MITILIWTLRATALTILAVTLLVILRRRSAAQRNLVLRIAVAVAWLLPIAALIAPRIEVVTPTMPAVQAISTPASKLPNPSIRCSWPPALVPCK